MTNGGLYRAVALVCAVVLVVFGKKSHDADEISNFYWKFLNFLED